ncbi:unnamed protein product, partial [Didymodactylos carnosus]
PSVTFAGKLAGVIIGFFLFLLSMIVMYIILACVGIREGYFMTNEPYEGGTTYALISSTHPNTSQYIPQDHWKTVEASNKNHPAYYSDTYNSQQRHEEPMSTPYINYNDNTDVRRQPQPTQYYENQPQHTQHHQEPEHTQYYQNQPPHQQQIDSSPRTQQQKDKNFVIEMPEKFLAGRNISPRSRERSIQKVVTDIGHIVEDAKKRYNGNVPNKVIVQVDKNLQQ